MTKGDVKRIMIAAAGSGSGKTVITCGLLKILKDRGYDPLSFKCGPDYIDPMFHRTVLGIDSRNLDTYLAGEEGVVKTLESAAGRYAVIEGVMGIYDGMSPDSLSGSCYEIASITDTPVILVVNASGTGRTVISLIKGILSDDTSKLIKGLILNRISDTFYEKLEPVLADELSRLGSDVRILGAIPKTDVINLESRHLGLKLPGETDDLYSQIAAFAKIMEDKIDIDGLINVMDRSGSGERVFPLPSASPVCACSGSRTLAVARDEAFCFYYPENIDFLAQLGMKIICFSPIHDAKIPESADAVLLGGGYPELWLQELSQNVSMLESVRSAIENGMPSIAECGGFMYLHNVIADRDGKEYAMVGAIDGKCTYTGHLVNFGYVKITGIPGTKNNDHCAAPVGMRGHEFHYYDSTCNGQDALLCKPSSGREYPGMIINPTRLWGWPHLYYPSVEERTQFFTSQPGLL